MATTATVKAKKTEPLIHVSEAAKRLGLSPKTIYMLIDMGQLAAINVFAGTSRRRSLRIDPAELVRFMSQAQTKPANNNTDGN